MEKLDAIVLDALEARVLAPERIPELLTAFLEKSDESDQRRREELRCFAPPRPTARALSTDFTSFWSRALPHRATGISPSALLITGSASPRLPLTLSRWSDS